MFLLRSLLTLPLVAAAAIRHEARQIPDSLRAQYEAFLADYQQGAFVENIYNSNFYETPTNFTGSVPGDVLKLERVSGTALNAQYAYPAGLTLWRLMYTSLDPRNETVPATAFVLAPYQKTKRTVAWTHGTAGITRDCTPSNQRQLYYDFTGLYNLALQGNNVVGPDYAGLGSDTQFNYVAGSSHAHDTSYSVIAARKALPHLCIDEWAAVGHSEGGLTAWATNEREAKYPSGGFLGSVSLAPSMDPLEINLRAFATEESRAALQASGSVFYPVFFLEVIRRLFPTLQLSDYLTPTGLSLLNLNLEGGCYAGAATFFPTFGLTEVWKDYSWLNSTEAKQWAELVRDSGRDKLAKPLLLIQGSEDEAVSAPVNYDAFENHCKMFENSPIQLSIYPGYRHGPVVNAAIQEWSAFLDDLFEHKKPRNFGNCKRVTLEPDIDGGENMEELYSVRWAPPPSQS